MDEFHRPTATFPNGAYNATQVRLYGLDGLTLPPLPDPDPDPDADAELTANPIHKPKKPKNDKVGTIGGREATLVAVEKDSNGNISLLSAEINCLSIDFLLGLIGIYVVTESDKVMWPAVIYGYAYEGHCYDLPKPKIMLLPAEPEWTIPDDDCGYDKKKAEGYKVWIVDKLDQCVEIDVSRGFVEQLVLETNLPGRRSPSTYRATMAVSHRSGRLME